MSRVRPNLALALLLSPNLLFALGAAQHWIAFSRLNDQLGAFDGLVDAVSPSPGARWWSGSAVELVQHAHAVGYYLVSAFWVTLLAVCVWALLRALRRQQTIESPSSPPGR